MYLGPGTYYFASRFGDRNVNRIQLQGSIVSSLPSQSTVSTFHFDPLNAICSRCHSPALSSYADEDSEIGCKDVINGVMIIGGAY